MFECILGLLGGDAKHKFQKIEQDTKNKAFFQVIDDTIKKIDLKETYLKDLGNKYISDIKKVNEVQNDPLKKHKQKNLLKIYKLYVVQRQKLLNIRFNIEQLRISLGEGTYLKDIYKVLFEGNERLNYLNSKMEYEDVDSIMENLKSSIDDLNEKSSIISSPIEGQDNDDPLSDANLDKELEQLILLGTNTNTNINTTYSDIGTIESIQEPTNNNVPKKTQRDSIIGQDYTNNNTNIIATHTEPTYGTKIITISTPVKNKPKYEIV